MEEHQRTREQIANLEEAMRLLNQQIIDRDTELKALLKVYRNTWSLKRKKKLGERSDAVAAAKSALKHVQKSPSK